VLVSPHPAPREHGPHLTVAAGRDDGGIRCGQLPPAGAVLPPPDPGPGNSAANVEGTERTSSCSSTNRVRGEWWARRTPRPNKLAIRHIEVPFRSLTVRHFRFTEWN